MLHKLRDVREWLDRFLAPETRAARCDAAFRRNRRGLDDDEARAPDRARTEMNEMPVVRHAVVVSRPILQSITVNDTTVTLVWSASAGKTYRVQYKPNLASARVDLAATGATATGQDIISSGAQRFYRVVVLGRMAGIFLQARWLIKILLGELVSCRDCSIV